jgi:ribosomal protein S18 acetylase RimI-like enzyme
MIIRSMTDSEPNRVAVQRLFDAAPAFSLITTGKFADPNEGEEAFTELPPGLTYADKFVYGVFLGEELIGCADILRGFRAANKATLGLFLLAQKYQGQGFGARAYVELEIIMASWPGIDTIRLGVIETNVKAFPFWRKMGFAENGERREKYPPLIADIIVMEKYLGEKNDLQTQ